MSKKKRKRKAVSTADICTDLTVRPVEEYSRGAVITFQFSFLLLLFSTFVSIFINDNDNPVKDLTDLLPGENLTLTGLILLTIIEMGVGASFAALKITDILNKHEYSEDGNGGLSRKLVELGRVPFKLAVLGTVLPLVWSLPCVLMFPETAPIFLACAIPIGFLTSMLEFLRLYNVRRLRGQPKVKGHIEEDDSKSKKFRFKFLSALYKTQNYWQEFLRYNANTASAIAICIEIISSLIVIADEFNVPYAKEALEWVSSYLAILLLSVFTAASSVINGAIYTLVVALHEHYKDNKLITEVFRWMTTARRMAKTSSGLYLPLTVGLDALAAESFITPVQAAGVSIALSPLVPLGWAASLTQKIKEFWKKDKEEAAKKRMSQDPVEEGGKGEPKVGVVVDDALHRVAKAGARGRSGSQIPFLGGEESEEEEGDSRKYGTFS